MSDPTAELLNAIQISANARKFDPLMQESIRLANANAREAVKPVDTSALARAGYEREMQGNRDIAGGLAMATSLPEFHQMANATYNRGLEARNPMAMGEGLYMPGTGYVADPFKAQGRLTKALAAQAQAARETGTAYGQEDARLHQQRMAEEHNRLQEEHLKIQRQLAGAQMAHINAQIQAGKLIPFKDANDNPMFLDARTRLPINPLAGMPAQGGGGIGGKPGAETVRQLAGVDAVAPLLDQFETLLKDYDPRSRDIMNPQKRALIDSVGAQLGVNLKEAYALGALTGPDVGILEKSVSSPGGAHAIYYGREGIQKQIESVRQNMAGRRAQMEQMYPRLSNVPSPYPQGAGAAPGGGAARPPLSSFGR